MESNIHILIVDNNRGDVRLIRDILSNISPKSNIVVSVDGAQALSLLKDLKNPYKPDLIILDLNMPKLDGRAALKEIRKDNALKDIHVLVLSTSREKADIELAKSYNADFCTKPYDFQEYFNVLSNAWNKWFVKDERLTGNTIG